MKEIFTMGTKNEYTAIVGQRVKSHRLAVGLNQEQVADLAGVSQPTISRIEKGEGVIDAATALRLAAGLGVRVGALLGPALMRGEVVTAGRPGGDDCDMSVMRTAAQAYLADFRQVTGQA